MSEIIFGTPEHIAGLSREALEADFRYVQDRRTELEEVCERLQAENEKLREERDVYRDLVGCMVHPDIPDQLYAENEKLRELVRYIMHQCNDGNPRCNECIDWNGGECVALQRMRELGVEV